MGTWCRPALVECPEQAQSTHYHRPGTGNAVWLTLRELPDGQKNIIVYPDHPFVSTKYAERPLSIRPLKLSTSEKSNDQKSRKEQDSENDQQHTCFQTAVAREIDID